MPGRERLTWWVVEFLSLAHEQIGKAVRTLCQRNCELADLPLEQLRQLNSVFDQDFYSCAGISGGADYSRCCGRYSRDASSAGLTEAKEKVESQFAGGVQSARMKRLLPDAEPIQQLDPGLVPATAHCCRVASPRSAKMSVISWWSKIDGEIVGCGALHLYGHAPGRDSLHHLDPSRQVQRRGSSGWSTRCCGRPEKHKCHLRLPVHAHSGILRSHGTCHGAARGFAGQNPQGLLRLSPVSLLR